jgi:tetratricopeptide (TPR) repeat protein
VLITNSREGTTLLDRQEHTGAQRNENCLATGDSADTLNRRGVIYKGQQNYESAAESYRREIELKPDFAEAHFNLGILLKDLGRAAEALDCFTRALDVRPDVPAIRLQLAETLASEGRLSEAESSFRELTIRYPNSAKSFFGLGNLYFGTRRFEQA